MSLTLTVPAQTTSSKRNSARLDVLKLLIKDTPTKKELSLSSSNSPRDSLSPLGDSHRDGVEARGRGRHGIDLSRSSDLSEVQHGKPQLTSVSQAGTQELQTKEQQHVSFREPDLPERRPSPATHVNTCSPRCLTTRDRRPCEVVVIRSNGLTTISVSELKHSIRDSRTELCDTKTQVPRAKPRRRLPKTPIREIVKAMGNTHSNPSSPTPDNASVRHSTRKPVRVLRKGSNNLLHRIESKTPLPPTVTSTVIQVHQQVSPPAIDGTNAEDDESPVDPYMGGHRSSRLPDVVPSASPVTITEETARQPLSAGTTIRESRSDTRAESRRGSRMSERLDSSEEVPRLAPSRPMSQASQPPIPPPHKRGSVLSPTIPAPSPLPEDSPHKYGLKDRMDTPEVPEPEEISIVKARRRSSGLEIFNEAKSLQSASSFLNGLSTSRRRAESAQRSTEASAWTLASYDTQRPMSSARLSWPPSRPSSTLPSNTYTADRRRGHNFKPSGFAYTRPLTHVQVKCYKKHTRLLPSRNKVAPVECSVCHIDDDRDHYSCSWCALRMCRYCRKDFAEKGITALRERIRCAEFGGSEDSADSGAESLGLSRGRSSLV